MPGANEILGFSRICFSRSPKFFQLVSKYFLRPSFLVTYPNFSLFRISFQILRKFAPCPWKRHFPPSFLVIYLHFLRKLAPWMPPGWMPGAVAPSAPPLHVIYIPPSILIHVINNIYYKMRNAKASVG